MRTLVFYSYSDPGLLWGGGHSELKQLKLEKVFSKFRNIPTDGFSVDWL